MSNRYVCLQCENKFNFLKSIIEPDGLDTPPYRHTECCPICGSDDIADRIGECVVCDREIYKGDIYYKLKSENEIFCDNCIERIE